MARDEDSIKILEYDLVTINSALGLVFVLINNIFLHPTFRNIKITITQPIDLSYIVILAHLIDERIKAYGNFYHTVSEK